MPRCGNSSSNCGTGDDGRRSPLDGWQHPGSRGGRDPPSVPASWGPLQLRRTIGKGSFGTVHLAWDPGLEREVALKFSSALSDRRPSSAKAVCSRASASERRDCVRDEFDGAVGRGWNSRRPHAQADAPSTRRVRRARGGPHRHGPVPCGGGGTQAGLVHRDIKAQNVMREAGGRIVLMDFGAGGCGRPPILAATQGTPLYLAPDPGRRTCDHRRRYLQPGRSAVPPGDDALSVRGPYHRRARRGARQPAPPRPSAICDRTCPPASFR